MRMGQGVRTGLGHGGITCVLQTQFSSWDCFGRKKLCLITEEIWYILRGNIVPVSFCLPSQWVISRRKECAPRNFSRNKFFPLRVNPIFQKDFDIQGNKQKVKRFVSHMKIPYLFGYKTGFPFYRMTTNN